MSDKSNNATARDTQPFGALAAFGPPEGNVMHIGAVTAAMRVKGRTRRHFAYARPRLANPGRVVPIYRGMREGDPRRVGEPSPASMGAAVNDDNVVPLNPLSAADYDRATDQFYQALDARGVALNPKKGLVVDGTWNRADVAAKDKRGKNDAEY